MNFEKAICAMVRYRGNVYSVQEALKAPCRWDAYWMLYNTPEASTISVCYDEWIKYVDYVRSKPE